MRDAVGTIAIGRIEGVVFKRLSELAGCGDGCVWHGHRAYIHNGFQVRHGDGEAIIVGDAAVLSEELPEDIVGWLKTLHPK